MLIFTLFLIIFLVLGYGFFLIAKPLLAIKLQQEFYKKINWLMEPVSLEKEIRNTRIMGLLLVGLTVLVVLFIIFKVEF